MGTRLATYLLALPIFSSTQSQLALFPTLTGLLHLLLTGRTRAWEEGGGGRREEEGGGRRREEEGGRREEGGERRREEGGRWEEGLGFIEVHVCIVQVITWYYCCIM